MALDGTYAGLRASVADFLNRGDLAAAIPDFITLAEAQINRRLRVRRMIGRSSAMVSAEFADTPDDFLGPISAVLGDNSVLDCVSVDAMAAMKCAGGSAPSGTPFAYALVGAQLQFFPAPATSTRVDLTYYARPPALAAAGSNWLLSDCPDVYLYGALLQSAPYLQDDARLSTWANLFTTLLDDLQKADGQEVYGARLTPRASQVA